MADHVVTLTDEESAAAKWSAVHNGEPSIEAWLYARLRGELAAAVQGYNGARDAAILSGVKATKNGTPVHDIVTAADAEILKPPPKPEPAPGPIEDVP
jgi:hypothetical protein